MVRETQSVDVLIRQKEKVDEYLKLPVKGRAWYVIDYQWWSKWCTYIDTATIEDSLDVASDDYPGEIDNTALLTDDGKLKPNLLREQDITLIPEEAWKLFVDYYGCAHTDTSVFRRTSVQTPAGRDVVEIYPPCFTFCDLQTSRKYFEGTYSEAQTIGELKAIVRKNLQPNNAVSVRLFVGDPMEELTEDDVTIGEASLERQKVLYVKLDTINGLSLGSSAATGLRTSRLNGSLSSSLLSGASSLLSHHTSLTRQLPGVCGLNNLGNTCFMNSAIQCMSNVPDLTEYFRDPRWKLEINQSNPLGTGGRIARAYAELIEHMWSGQFAYEVPRTLKREIALIASQFSGYAQHDSHELLVFLLDGLHEDLNRVKKKPYIEFKDAGDRPDEVVAQEAWQNHLARNDSIIVNLFHGQLKSTVVCPTCHYKSVTFDPFASLNLPLPDLSRYTRHIYVWPWVPRAGSERGPIRIELTVPMEFYVRDLLALLQQQRMPHPGCKYYLTDVYNHSVGRPWHLEHLIRDRHEPPVFFAYELPPGELIPVRFHQPSSNTSGWVGIPFFISVSHTEPVIDEPYLVQAISSRLRAIGIQSLECADSTQINMSSVNEAKAGDDLFPGSSTLLSRLGETAGTSTSVSSTSKPIEVDYRLKMSNGDECQIGRFLMGRIHLLDDLNRNLIQSSITPAALESANFRLSVECTGSSLQAQMDEMWCRIGRTQTSSSIKTTVSLAHCFEKFISAEKLGTRDLWYCSRCKGEKQATKKFDLWSLPKVLVIQLKRFRSTLRWRDKIDTFVDFPIRNLDLSPWVVSKTNERFVYDLIAVSNHMGHLGGGHYTAYALNDPTKRWYVFDDASTREISESHVVTESAYVLVYQRVSEASPATMSNMSNISSDHLSVVTQQPQAQSVAAHTTPMYINDDDLTNVE